MCYLVAKKFDKQGCVAIKTKHGKELSNYIKLLQQSIGDNGVQLVTISRPSAYGEYEPYEIIDNKKMFSDKVMGL